MDRSIRTPNPKRITLNSLKDWVNSEFERLEITDYECYEVVRTRFTSDQYEGGACKLHINFRHKEKGTTDYFHRGTILGYLSISELKHYINTGWNLCLKQADRKRFELLVSLEQLELDITKY